MVSTLDFESSDPGSNPGRTSFCPRRRLLHACYDDVTFGSFCSFDVWFLPVVTWASGLLFLGLMSVAGRWLGAQIKRSVRTYVCVWLCATMRGKKGFEIERDRNYMYSYMRVGGWRFGDQYSGWVSSVQ